jgi:hypothetical protein
VWRVYVTDPSQVLALTNGDWDVLESRGSDYLRILGDSAIADALRARGYRVVLDEVIPANAARAPLTYYGGYHTVAEHEAHLEGVAAQRSDLARRVAYGISWRKAQGRTDGHDLVALCITRIRPGDCDPATRNGKPRFVVTAGMHARELVPPELAWRWIDYLTGNADTDPEIATLLESIEVWVIAVANPDGRSIVESGGNSPLMQRKNANNSAGGCLIPNIGVDLNRNSGFKWGGYNSSPSPCNQFYRGTAPESEPETTALEALMHGLYDPQARGAQLTGAAPLTTTGIALSLHSDGNLMMIPWDWTSTHSPNDTGFRSIAFRLSYFNGYRTGQSSEVLYLSSGTFEDWIYGQFGVPSLTYEIGSSFMPAYSLIDSTYWPANRDSLIYAAKLALQPYTLALGPAALLTTPGVTSTQAGTPLNLTAWIDDQRYGTNGYGRPAAQPIAQAEYYVDTPPWSGGTPFPMNASDGAFNTSRELTSAVLDTNLPPGRHTVFVRGRDAGGNWGPPSALWLDLTLAPVLSATAYVPFVALDPAPAPENTWIDASSGGTVVSVGDDIYQAVTLPFPFNFYGNAYTRAYVSSNGFISFGSGSSSFKHGCLPSAAAPNNAIYALWDDLVPTGGANGNVYVKTVNPDTFVVEWHQVKRYNTTAQQTFEIVLRSDNSILLQYQAVSDTFSTTTGIENATGTTANQVWCNGSGTAITNTLALQLP